MAIFDDFAVGGKNGKDHRRQAHHENSARARRGREGAGDQQGWPNQKGKGCDVPVEEPGRKTFENAGFNDDATHLGRERRESREEVKMKRMLENDLDAYDKRRNDVAGKETDRHGAQRLAIEKWHRRSYDMQHDRGDEKSRDADVGEGRCRRPGCVDQEKRRRNRENAGQHRAAPQLGCEAFARVPHYWCEHGQRQQERCRFRYDQIAAGASGSPHGSQGEFDVPAHQTLVRYLVVVRWPMKNYVHINRKIF